jgi:orotidine-5'-phosphate decarboxylase
LKANSVTEGKRLFVALDFPDAEAALAMVEKLAPLGVGFKVGLELYTATGPKMIQSLRQLLPGGLLFLDLKFHDIPATVAGALRSALGLGVNMLNIHMSGGEGMVREAVSARDEAVSEGERPALIGVTVLTSLAGEDLAAVWDRRGVDAQSEALRLAQLARDWGLDGVVASAREAAAIREACGPDFLIVTPGIRPAGAGSGDQKRVTTPADAIGAGASHLVVGRPITRSADPVRACSEILADIADALS